MPNKPAKKLGNELDYLSPPIEPPEGLSEKEAGEFKAQAIHAHRIIQLGKLAEHYGLEDEGKNLWYKLTYKLAVDFVPAMNFRQKKGAPTKWGFFEHLGLYALLEVMRAHHANTITTKELFNKAPKIAQRTFLKSTIKPNVSPDSLENRFYQWQKTKQGKESIRLLENVANTNQERIEFLEEFLTRDQIIHD